MSTPPLESSAQTIERLRRQWPSWSCWHITGGSWFASRRGELTDEERVSGPLPPLEADSPEELVLKMRMQEGVTLP